MRYSNSTPQVERCLVRRMADVKSERSRIFDVNSNMYLVTFLTSKDDFLVAAKNGLVD